MYTEKKHSVYYIIYIDCIQYIFKFKNILNDFLILSFKFKSQFIIL